MLTSQAIRQRFFDFFAERAHTVVPSSPVVPLDDPTLLFTNAGMNQFKDVFLGTGNRSYVRAVDTQKCIRAGGKHNDLDDVGHDTYHHTFFEMLGNWSFGDYFKEDAIRWAWQLLVEDFGIPAERLHATYFGGDEADGLPPDDEARSLWLDVTGIDASRVHPFGKKDNFWEMADTGPCGPCTEIHVDLTPDLSGGPLVNADDARVIEVWNLVFIQFNRATGGVLHPLPARHVDTGMGFERLAAVLQGKTSNYDTDVFAPLMEAIRIETGAHSYGATVPSAQPSPWEMRDITYRIVADHLRCLSFAITDGALPDNDGRGYVLRRILRRGYRYGRQYLGVDRPFIHKLVPALVDHMGDAFPELRQHQDRVVETLHEEEQSFARTLDTGLKLFAVAADTAERESRAIDGETAFKLHDTFGFPIDLTRIIASEKGLDVDVEGYEQHMEAARALARRAGKSDDEGGRIMDAVALLDADFFADTATDDSPKYIETEHATSVVGWVGVDGSFHQSSPPTEVDVALVLSSTCFYAEQGGQVGDRGEITSDSTGDDARFEVTDTQRAQDTVLHMGRLISGQIAPGTRVTATVDSVRRDAIMANHTATHLLNHALRDVLGEHVEQRGSLVDETKTRFDFSHRKAIDLEQIERIENSVIDGIGQQLRVYDQIVPLPRARAVNSLRAVFGEKYPDLVRVVSIGVPVDDLLDDPDGDSPDADWSRYSIELCGGTHVAETTACGPFVLASEEPVAKGVRRLVAHTGAEATAALGRAQAFELRLAELSSQAETDDLEALRSDLSSIIDDLAKTSVPILAGRRIQPMIEALQGTLREHKKAEASEQGAQVREQAAALLDDAASAGETKIIAGQVPGAPVDQLRAAIDWLRQKATSAAVLLISVEGAKITLMAGLTPDLVEAGHDARKVLRQACTLVGGGGGGRPDLAQGGGKDASQVKAALDHTRQWLQDHLG